MADTEQKVDALTQEQVKRDIGQLESNLGVRMTKYIRNYNRYMNNGSVKDQIDNIDTNPPQGYWWNTAYPDTGPIPMLNVLRSMVDTVCSKLAQMKVRPFFNPVNGNWRTRKICRGALQFFDLWFDNQHLFKKAILSRRDSLVFEVGTVWLNDDEGTAERIMPWDFLFDRAEFHYGQLTRVAVRRRTYPVGYLANADWLTAKWKAEIKRNRIQKVKLVYYYDLLGGKKSYWINDEFVAEKPIDFTCSPVVWTFYSDPIKGAFSVSLVDDQYTSQTLVDTIAERLELAVELTPANFTLLPEGSNLKRSMWSNETGAVYEYMPQPFVNAVPQVINPAPISPEYLEILKYVIESMYSLEGVSQLSATSVKPTGITSGVALETLQNVESERFEVLQDEHQNFLMRITETAIEVFPKNADILPKTVGRAVIKWKEVKEQRGLYSIQFAPVSALSKDPQTKMQQVEKLLSMKIIPPDEAPEYLEFPDTEKLMSNLTAVEDVLEHIVERAIEDGEFEYDLVVPGTMLEQWVLRELYRLDAADEDEDIVANCRQFLGVVQKNNAAMAQTQAPPPQPPAPAQPPMQPPQVQGPTGPLPMEGAPIAPGGPPAPGAPAMNEQAQPVG